MCFTSNLLTSLQHQFLDLALKFPSAKFSNCYNQTKIFLSQVFKLHHKVFLKQLKITLLLTWLPIKKKETTNFAAYYNLKIYRLLQIPVTLNERQIGSTCTAHPRVVLDQWSDLTKLKSANYKLLTSTLESRYASDKQIILNLWKHACAFNRQSFT